MPVAAGGSVLSVMGGFLSGGQRLRFEQGLHQLLHGVGVILIDVLWRGQIELTQDRLVGVIVEPCLNVFAALQEAEVGFGAWGSRCRQTFLIHRGAKFLGGIAPIIRAPLAIARARRRLAG